MTSNSQDSYSTRILCNIIWGLWIIIQVSFNILRWVFKKTNWMVRLTVILMIALYFHETAGSTKPLPEKALVIYDIPTPTEQRLIDLKGTTWEREDVNWYINLSATEYNVSEDYMHKIIRCESQYVQDIQSRHIQSYGQEESFGLVQIHLPAHPYVSYEEAINPQFAINFLAKNLSHGRASMWTCSRYV